MPEAARTALVVGTSASPDAVAAAAAAEAGGAVAASAVDEADL